MNKRFHLTDCLDVIKGEKKPVVKTGNFRKSINTDESFRFNVIQKNKNWRGNKHTMSIDVNER